MNQRFPVIEDIVLLNRYGIFRLSYNSRQTLPLSFEGQHLPAGIRIFRLYHAGGESRSFCAELTVISSPCPRYG